MTVRVRFAPSPTGYLHIGGARTCLYNYLYAKACGGKTILRIEDTDTERSSKDFEFSQIQDLLWLGVEFDEGPHVGGEFGPYRQSERLDKYKNYADNLVKEKKAFACFCSEQVLEEMKELAIKEGRDPHYDGRCSRLTQQEVEAKLKKGETAAIRFKAPKKSYSFVDQVRGEVTFPDNMVGDFVILRSSGMPTYNYSCVVDDLEMKITHVIRAEEHLNNTVRQLMLYEAFNATAPTFAHVSLLVGADRQKLSKRHGATSVSQYREQGYIPSALCNYLCLLGWSHPEEKDLFTMQEASSVFGIDRFSKSPALYDIEKLNWVNGQYLKKLEGEDLHHLASSFLEVNPLFGNRSLTWQKAFLGLYQEKVQTVLEYQKFLDELFVSKPEITEAVKEVLSWSTTSQIKDFLKERLNQVLASGNEFIQESDVDNWMNELKKNGVKGKNLFMGMRVALTGQDHGADLKRVLTLTPVSLLLKRLE